MIQKLTMPLMAGMFLTLSGCATLHFPWDDKIPVASAKNPVVQITCLWEPSEGHDPDGMPCRGFAGQILFLGNKGGTPVQVDGPVMVYVFDDQGTPEQQAAPQHQFNFDLDSWQRHMKAGSLGPTYHVFIPYTRKGTQEALCSLRVRYTPPEGPPLYSPHSEITMGGKKRSGNSSAEVISHHGKRPDGDALDGPRTTTIPLNGRESHDPGTNEEFDQERANFLLQQFLLDQTKKDLDRAQQSGAMNRGWQSDRIRWTGENVERIGHGPRRSLADVLPTAEPVAATDHPLSSHPFAEPTTPAPKRIKGMSHRHPLGDDAAFTVEPRMATRTDAEPADLSDAESLGQTSQFDWAAAPR